ncbi:hypothetical protein [Pseudonocardia alaniniphila]|uniref:Uncharacterized protein n=1 Tax=Pseudonocardia alaniniphila TaxID=75291 RepID=A0ABS9T9Z1_9PSEU|nr:hypothetical protein [Pseudonocardia alaniniphila]MCH6165350.1 hypothetical protein [Pseudonocardia alaniniphila]
MPKQIFVAFDVDVGAVVARLGACGGEDSPSDIARGLFACSFTMTIAGRGSMRSTTII